MGTCKDCIHYGICEYSTITDKQVKCKDFIFKEDYVKVVRCKYCKWWIDEKCINVNGAYNAFISNPNWFCSSGVQK